MPRPRTKHLDLPRRLGRDPRSSAFRYKRPDVDRHVYLGGSPKETAIQLAETLNTAFGVRPPNGMRHLYRTQFKAFDWRNVDPAIRMLATIKLPDLMPLERGNAASEKLRHSWAYALPEAGAYRKGLKHLEAKDLEFPEKKPWVRVLFMAARKNSAARGIAFDLTLEDVARLVVASKGRCTVTGMKLSNDRGELPHGKKMRRPWAPSLDRMDSSKGYSLENCRVVCCAANYAMSQWGEAVLMEMAKSMARKRIRRMHAPDLVTTG